MPHEFISRFQCLKRVYRSLIARLQRVGRALSNCRAEAVRSKGTHVSHHGELEGGVLATIWRRCETVGLTTALRHVVVCGIRLKASDGDMNPNAAAEISIVRGILDHKNISTTILENPTRDDVLLRLKTCDIAHFACHGVVDAEDPSQSKLMLEDWSEHPLNVKALLQTADVSCKLVVLSACEKVVSKDVKLREEGIHLSGGFQMAGVSHVVGTLWKVEDEFSAEFMKTFYSSIRSTGGLEIRSSAEALRKAVIDARSKGVDALK